MENQHCKTLTVIEAAKWLGVSRNTAYEQVQAGTLPALRLGRRILVPKAALAAMLGAGAAMPWPNDGSGPSTSAVAGSPKLMRRGQGAKVA
jgi:excisionase family DNA binding protein